MLPNFLENLRIGIVGFGVNNRALTRWLVKHGAGEVVVYDENPNARNHGTTLNVEWELGEGALEKISADIIYKSPGIPFDRPEILAAEAKGIKISSQTELFLTLCNAKTVGITGTKGKGTTSTLIANIMERHYKDIGGKVYLAGNIGRDPFEFLDDLRPHDLVVLELSSFQLENIRKSPNVAVVLGITEDHIDYHHSVDAYHDAKTGIVRNQTKDDVAILSLDNKVSFAFAQMAISKVYYYSIIKSVDMGVFLKGDAFNWREDLDIMPQVIAYASDTQMPGAHNLSNIAAAITTCLVLGAKINSIIPEIRQYKGLPHRIEKVLDSKGISWYNDSASTNPDTTIAAINSFLEKKILIAGGSDKGIDYNKLGETLGQSNVKKLILMGVTAGKISSSAQAHGFSGEDIIEVENLEDAVKTAKDFAEAGDVVLLSPASASFDMFTNYEVRGNHFKSLVERTVDK